MGNKYNNKNHINWPHYLQFDLPMMSCVAYPLHSIPIKLQLISIPVFCSHFKAFLFKLSNRISHNRLVTVIHSNVAGYSAVTPKALYSVA